MRIALLRTLLAITLILTLLPTPCLADAAASAPADRAEDYEVIVVGGEPEGVAAAVAAARNGRRTLLLVAEHQLGGLFTQAELNTLDLNYAPNGQLANTGIFAEFFQAIGSSHAFDVDQAQLALCQLVNRESNLTVRYDRPVLEAQQSATHLDGVTVDSPDGPERYRGELYIDATADADLAALCGVPFTLLRADIGQPGVGMGSTLLLHLRQVDWDALRAEAASGRLGTTGSSATAIWGMPEIAHLYQPQQPDVFLRGLNIGRQNDGSVLINALVIFGMDPLDEESYRQGMARGRAEAPHVLQWLRENVGGFEQAELAEWPQALYVRESRHMQGLYRLTVTDVLDSRIFPDAIAFGSYPLDIQASSPTDLGFVVGNPRLYSIPLRCLIPPDLDNLLVTGRSASYDSLAAGSARVVPVGMATAQAAGVAAAVALEEDVPVQALAERENYQAVQQRLRQQGVQWLVDQQYASAFPDHPATPALKQLVSLGLVFGGYENDWRLGQVVDERAAANLLAAALQRTRDDAKAAAGALYTAAQAGVPLDEQRLRELSETALQQLPLDNWQPWLRELLGKYDAPGYDRGLLYRFVADFLQHAQPEQQSD